MIRINETRNSGAIVNIIANNSCNLDQSQEAAVDLSPEAGGATDRRDRRQTRERSRQHSLNYRQNYSNLARYDTLNVSDPGPSTSQSSRQTMPRNESRTAGKRPMRAMTPQEKMDAIGRVHTGESKAAVARDIGVPESTLRGWCKAEEKIRTQLNNVRATGSYEHILTSSSDNSDNSRPGSSSRSTPTQNTPGTSADRVNEEPEAGPAPKRVKLENNLTSAAAAAININNMSTSSSRAPTIGSETLFNPYLYNLLANDPSKTLALFNSIMKGETLLPFSGYSPATNLLTDNLQLHRNNGAMASITMANMLPTSSMLVNGKRKNHNILGLTSTMEMPTRVATRRQNSQSPNAEKPSGSIAQPTNHRTSPMPSTSTNNGSMINNTSTKSSKDCKKLNAIICQLQQQHVPSVRMYNMGEMISSNAMNNNNNNIDHVDNETTNGRSPSSLPPGFGDMLTYCTKLVEWLQTYGSPICTFQQVTQIRIVLENMMNWANSKGEFEIKKKSNDTS